MTIIYVTESNCENLAVTFQNSGVIKIQTLEDISKDENIIYEVYPLESFIGKNHLRDITDFSVA